jgi:hypothetical protein
MDAIRKVSRDHGVPCGMQSVGAMFQVVHSFPRCADQAMP